MSKSTLIERLHVETTALVERLPETSDALDFDLFLALRAAVAKTRTAASTSEEEKKLLREVLEHEEAIEARMREIMNDAAAELRKIQQQRMLQNGYSGTKSSRGTIAYSGNDNTSGYLIDMRR